MDKRWKKAPKKSFICGVENKTATPKHDARPHSFAKHKLGTSCRRDDCLAVFRFKVRIGGQGERRRSPNKGKVSRLQESRSGVRARQLAFSSFDPAEQEVIALSERNSPSANSL